MIEPFPIYYSWSHIPTIHITSYPHNHYPLVQQAFSSHSNIIPILLLYHTNSSFISYKQNIQLSSFISYTHNIQFLPLHNTNNIIMHYLHMSTIRAINGETKIAYYYSSKDASRFSSSDSDWKIQITFENKCISEINMSAKKEQTNQV